MFCCRQLDTTVVTNKGAFSVRVLIWIVLWQCDTTLINKLLGGTVHGNISFIPLTIRFEYHFHFLFAFGKYNFSAQVKAHIFSVILNDFYFYISSKISLFVDCSRKIPLAFYFGSDPNAAVVYFCLSYFFRAIPYVGSHFSLKFNFSFRI